MNQLTRTGLLTTLLLATSCVDDAGTADASGSTPSEQSADAQSSNAQGGGKRIAPGVRPDKPASQPSSQPKPPPADPDPDPKNPAKPMPPGTTPTLTAAFKEDTLHLEITAPSGGHEFKLIQVEAKGKDSEVKVCYVTPGEGQATTSALVDHDLQTAITTKGGSVRIYLQERQRGAEYFVEPEFKLVHTVAH